MKTKLATTLAIITSMTLPLLQADDPNLLSSDLPVPPASSVPRTTQLEIKIMQIELDVALKQYEKIVTTLAAAALDFRLTEPPAGENDEQFKKRLIKAEEKSKFLEMMKDRLREEILGKGAEIEAQQKKWGISADPMSTVPRALPTPPAATPNLTPTPRPTDGGLIRN